MGFGLPICKRFVEGHGGKISVKSRLGVGSEFVISIPLEPKVEERSEKTLVEVPESLLVADQERPTE